MATIHIKNVGPLKDTGEIALNKLLLIIGKQSSGKSTFMKVLCHCRWVEKTLMVDDDSSAKDYDKEHLFLDSLKTFHRFNPDFFSSDSYIKYDGDYITIEQNGDEADAVITRKESFEDRRYNTKLCFIPSERNLISAVKNLDKTYKATELDVLLNYLLEWDEVKDYYSTKNALRLSVARNIHYYNDGGADFIYLSQNGKKLPVFYASSGVQSAMPIEVMIDRYSAVVGEKASLSKHDWRHIFDEMKDSNIAQNVLTTKANKAYYQSVQFFIEEPEQNLYPLSQKDLLLNVVKHLVAANRNEKASPRSMVVMTTHSPYILSVLNELMAEAKLYDKHYENYIEGVDDFVNYDCYMSPDYYSAYYINDNGTFENLIDSELPMISGVELDGVSDWVEERISKVNNFIYG
ncbi:MAG: ATP-binding protein [Paludibacteraceae bacterium]|nr:ATP-binding protein [Paludibacteraceae bacterium]